MSIGKGTKGKIMSSVVIWVGMMAGCTQVQHNEWNKVEAQHTIDSLYRQRAKELKQQADDDYSKRRSIYVRQIADSIVQAKTKNEAKLKADTMIHR